MIRCFFLLIHFLVVEDYELPKSTNHVLSVPLNLECIRILSLSFIFSPTLIVSLMMFCVRFLSEVMIMLSTRHVTNHLTCCNKLEFDLKNMRMQYQKYHKMQFCIQLKLVFGKLFHIYKLIHIDLQPRILKASFLLAPLLNI